MMPESPSERFEDLRRHGWRCFQVGLLMLIASAPLHHKALFFGGTVAIVLSVIYVRLANQIEEKFRKDWIDSITGRKEP